VRQNLYTCCRCGEEACVPVDTADPPIGWACVTYERVHALDDSRSARMTLTTHACERCADETLAFLERVTAGRDVDRAFDGGGAA
jgi:hypothetical protein